MNSDLQILLSELNDPEGWTILTPKRKVLLAEYIALLEAQLPRYLTL